MIQPLKYGSNVSFRGTTNEEKTSIKTRALNVLKGVNNVTNTTGGAIRGAAEGIGAAAVIGLIGKNIKESKANIFGTLGGMAKDTGAAIWSAVKFVPALITKAPVENVKDIVTLPVKFYKNYLKGNKATGALATIAAAGVLAFRTVQGKMNANLKNADIDHATNTKH